MKAIRLSLLAGLLSADIALPLRAELANGIKVICHDSVVTYQEVEMLTAPSAKLLQQQLGSQPELYQKKVNDTLNDNMEFLLERQLVLHDFKAGGYTIPESIIENAVEEEIRDRYGDRAKLTKTLQAQGMTYERFRQQTRDKIVIRALQGKNISQEIIISPHKIETFYLAHKDNYKLEDEVKLRRIMLNKPTEADAEGVRKLAEEIRAKIKSGAAFSEMASVYSQAADRDKGGLWGWVERPILRKELADVAFALPPGEVSDVIEVGNACYLLLVEEKRASHIKALSEVRDEVEKTLMAEERTRLQKVWIDRLKKKTFVRYF